MDESHDEKEINIEYCENAWIALLEAVERKDMDTAEVIIADMKEIAPGIARSMLWEVQKAEGSQALIELSK